jgi:hypothetical protein
MNGPPPVVSSAHDVENCERDGVDVVQHLAVAGADDDVPASHEFAISGAIPLERRAVAVPLVAVDLDHEPFADEKVDSADTHDRHLASEMHVEVAQGESHERLRS